MSLSFPFFIAKRYFFSGKKKTFITVISIISVMALALSTMSLIIVLSVFNGLEHAITSIYNSFDPDIKISPKRGKTFNLDEELIGSLERIEGVSLVTQVLEDNALVKYKDAQIVAKVKGLGNNFAEQGKLDPFLVEGELKLTEDNKIFALIGRGIQHALSVAPKNDFYALQMFYPRDIGPGKLNPASLYIQKNIKPIGVFAVEKYYDENYILVPLQFAEGLMDSYGKRSSLEIQLAPNASSDEVKKRILPLLGKELKAESQDEQHHGMIRAVRIEKLFVHLVFVFILAVVSFNIFYSLGMLAIDKQKDIATLYALGAHDAIIKRIFILEGTIIAFSGTGIGLLLGYIICWAQKNYGLVRIGMQGAVIDAYPILMKWEDFGFIALVIMVLTLASSYRPAILATRNKFLGQR